ncbi:MAG: acyl-CoA dehydrogenase family protein [Candidatus Pristimantibacillus sp.]
MRFQLSEEQEMAIAVIREFAEKEVAPAAGKRDENQYFDRALFDQIGGLGLAGIAIPEQYGGAGSDILTFAIVIEELSRVCASTAAVLAVHTAYTMFPILKFGSEELKQRALKPLALGEKLGGFGSRSASEKSIRKKNSLWYRDKGDHVVLNGIQPLLVNAGAADLYVIIADQINTKNRRKCNAYVIESGIPGMNVGIPKTKLGLRSLMTSDLLFDNCIVSKENRLGKEGQGEEIISAALAIGYISAAAQAVGIAQGAMEAATSYAKERKQFGIQIGRRQGVSFKLSDMAAKIEAARLLTYQASWRLNEGLTSRKETAIAKKFATDTAVAVTLEAIQVLGGYGYMREYRMERFLRDAKCLESEIGTGGIRADWIKDILSAE